jgi:two-component system LytT family response regulator
MKVLIVDDEPIAREGLRLLLASEPDVRCVLEARHGREATAVIRNEAPNLVLLDVQMPQMDGFNVIQAIGAERMPPVVFVTAFDQYAVQAFEINAIDYLLKPVAEDRFRIAFQRARNRLRDPLADSQRIAELLESLAGSRKHLNRLAVRVGEKTVLIDISDVDWFEADENYVRVHAAQATHLVHVPLAKLQESLDPDRFLRIHRSLIVNVRRVKQLWTSKNSPCVVELTNGVRLQSGRSYAQVIRLRFSNPF